MTAPSASCVQKVTVYGACVSCSRPRCLLACLGVYLAVPTRPFLARWCGIPSFAPLFITCLVFSVSLSVLSVLGFTMLNLYRNAASGLARASKPAVALTSATQQAKLVPAVCDQSKYTLSLGFFCGILLLRCQ